MSQTTSPMTPRAGSVTPRRRGHDQLQRDEVEQLAAATPVLLRLPDLFPNAIKTTESESPHRSLLTDFTSSLPLLSVPANPVGPEVNDSPLPAGSSESMEQSELDTDIDDTIDSDPQVVRGDWSQMGGRIFVGLLSILVVVAIASSVFQGGETKPNVDDPLHQTRMKAEVEEDPASNDTNVKPSLVMEPFVARATEIVGVEQTAERIATSTTDPYVKAVSGELPVEATDDLQGSDFVTHTLRPAADPATKFNQSYPSVRLGQPTEYPNDSFYR